MSFLPAAAIGQMMPASKAALAKGTRRAKGTGGPRKRRRRAKAFKKARTTRRKSGKKMKFGSPAWQKKYRVGAFAKKR